MSHLSRQPSTSRSARSSLTQVALAIAAVTLPSATHAAVYVFSGATSNAIDLAANWTPATVPTSTATVSDVATFNGTKPGNLPLTYASSTSATFTGGAGTQGITISVTPTQLGSIDISNSAATAQSIRVKDITLDAGSGAFSIGTGTANPVTLVTGGASVLHTFTNNSANAATIGSNVTVNNGGSATQSIVFDGSGNWNVNAVVTYSGGTSVVTKQGTGTMTVTRAWNGGGNTIANYFVKAGTLVLDTGALLNPSAFSSVGQSGTDSGTMTVRGTGEFRARGDLNVGDVGSSVGVLNIQDNANVNTPTGGIGLFVGSANGAGSSASGTVNQSGGTLTTNSTNDGTYVLGGRNAATTLGVGTHNFSGGTVTVRGNGWVGGFGTGTLNQSGGTFNAGGFLSVARQVNSVGTANVNGGALNQTAAAALLIVGESGNGTLNLSGGGAVNAAGLQLARNAGSTGVANLNGGTLTTGSIQTGATPGTSTANLNGTTIRPTAASATFFQGLSFANVQGGGAIFDTAGFDVTVAQALAHDPALAGNDGGLTKLGAGILTLAGANGYTGNTTVNAGTLALGAADRIADASNVALGGGALETAGNSETLGTLSVNAASTLGLGSGASVVRFAGSALSLWTGPLTITNWSGTPITGGGVDQVLFGSSIAGLTAAQLAQITFAGYAPGAAILPSGEIVPVPEPVALLGLAGGALALLGRRRPARQA